MMGDSGGGTYLPCVLIVGNKLPEPQPLASIINYSNCASQVCWCRYADEIALVGFGRTANMPYMLQPHQSL